jgi:dienelactone hydrolase
MFPRHGLPRHGPRHGSLLQRGCASALFAAFAVTAGVARTPAAPSPSPAAAASAGPSETSTVKAPPGPPDGTYVYAISRNGTDQGKTTVTLFRRDDAGELETNESGYAGAASAQIVGSYRYADLTTASYVATYRAPFLKSSPFGALFGPSRPLAVALGPLTVRYRIDGMRAKATIDGVVRSREWPVPVGTPKPPVKSRWIFDAPFMTGVMLVPVYRHRSSDAVLAPISAAFDEGVDLVSERVVSSAPHFPKTSKTDVALEIAGVGTIWFNRRNWIVDEVHFDGLNLDAHLLSYSRTPSAAAAVPDDAATSRPHVSSRALAFASQDGTQISGILDLPAGGKPRAPALVFVPPGSNASLNFPGDGPDPMYPNLALAYAERGYAIVRYAGREAAANAAPSTWEQSIADIQGALSAAAGDDAIDPNRIYLLGYGVGADLALAAAGAPDVHVAGVVALGPSVIGYRECASRTKAPEAGAFFKSASAHDPAILAARSRVPVFVLHSGAPACGETAAETTAYDDNVRAANARATIVVASDLSARFGGLYDADSALDTQEFFPYHFDASTRDAIGDWLDNPKAATLTGSGPAPHGPRPPAPPPPPPVTDSDMNGEMPNPHALPTPRSVDPGVVLPSGVTPPPYQPDASPLPQPAPTLTPASTPTPEPTPSPASTPAPTPKPS